MDFEPTRRKAIRLEVGTIIDGGDGPPVNDAALLVIDGRIAAVGPSASVPRPDDARNISLPGATALPGLIDSHVHVTMSGFFDPLTIHQSESDEELTIRGVVNAERMLRAGVTTAYDCGARGSTAFAIRNALAAGLAAGPRLLVSGRPVTQTAGHCHFFDGEADGVDGVREAIRRLIEDEGADGIKMMATGGGLTEGTDSRLATYPLEVMAAAADETHRLGRRITAHAHGVPGIARASEAGIDSIQHCTMMGMDHTWAFDEDVARGMAERGTRAVPTIGVGQRIEADEGVTISSLQANPGKMTRDDHYANTRRLREAGVTLLPGTDVGINLTDFGEEFFFEMEAFVDTGFTPLETIRAATAGAASHLGIEHVTGTLRPGLAADVLVVEGRPDDDITQLRRPLLVLRDGHRIPPTTPPPAPDRHDRP